MSDPAIMAQFEQRLDSVLRRMLKSAAGIDGSARSELRQQMLRDSYAQLLEELFSRDFLYASLMARSDLVVSYFGKKADERDRSVQLIESALGKTRHEVAQVARALMGIDGDDADAESIPIGLSGMARGSLVLGFNAVRSTATDEGGQELVTRRQLITKTAMREISRVARVASMRASDVREIEGVDAVVREAAIEAVYRLTPSTRSAFDAVWIEAPQPSGASGGAASEARLTTDSRKEMKPVLSRPELRGSMSEIDGEVRAVDVDLHRLTIRLDHAGKAVRVRIAVSAAAASTVEWTQLVQRRIAVRGVLEVDSHGAPRVMAAESVRVVAAAQQALL